MRTGRTPEQQERYEYVTSLIASGITNREVSRITGLSVSSVMRYKQTMPPDMLKQKENKHQRAMRLGFSEELDEAAERLRKYYRRARND